MRSKMNFSEMWDGLAVEWDSTYLGMENETGFRDSAIKISIASSMLPLASVSAEIFDLRSENPISIS